MVPNGWFVVIIECIEYFQTRSSKSGGIFCVES